MPSYKKGQRVWFSLDYFKTRQPVTIAADHNGQDYLVQFIIDGGTSIQYVGSGDIEPMNAMDLLADAYGQRSEAR